MTKTQPATEKKWRPYTAAELRDLIGVVVVSREGMLEVVTGISNVIAYVNGRWYSPAQLLEEYTFLSGERCGVLE